LIPLYRDYVDQDGLEQPNGAEAGDYDGAGPANRVLRRPDEWLSLLGVREQIRPAAWRRIREHLAMDSTSPNETVNTATAETMRILYGATPSQAEAAIRAREQQPFLSFAAFAAATGLPDTSGDSFYTFPSGRIILTIADSRSAWVYRSRLTLTPSGLERPVWIDQTELKEAPGRAVAGPDNESDRPLTQRDEKPIGFLYDDRTKVFIGVVVHDDVHHPRPQRGQQPAGLVGGADEHERHDRHLRGTTIEPAAVEGRHEARVERRVEDGLDPLPHLLKLIAENHGH
jgi:hypothetical protein